MFSQDKYIKAMTFLKNLNIPQINKEELLFKNSLISMEIFHVCMNTKLEEEKINHAIISALLCDVLEKNYTNYDEVFDIFGLEVAEYLMALSVDSTLPKKEQQSDMLNKIMSQPYEIQMIKLAQAIILLNKPSTELSSEEIYSRLQDAKFIYSCLKNSNINLSQRLEKKILEYRIYIK